MRIYLIVVLCLGLAIIFLVGLAKAQSRIKRVAQSTSTQSAESQEAKQITCTGNVVDAQGRPIAGAKVRLYESVYGRTAYSFDIRLAGEATTETGGAFSFSTSAESDSYRDGYIVAEKEGLALGCGYWDMQEGNKVLEIKLGRPKKLAGVVVDEDDTPISDVKVSVSLLIIGKMEDRRALGREVASKLLTASTDTAGKFAFTNLPAEAAVEFLIKKPGRATINTYNPQTYGSQGLQFSPGQTDIKLTQPVEAKIEGIIVEKDSGKPTGGVVIAALREGRTQYFREEPVVSKEDGTFRINALTAGKYILQLVRPREGFAD